MNSSFLQRSLQDSPLLVTGTGVICAAGLSPAEVWANVLAGTCSARFQDFFWGKQTLRKAVCPAVPFESLIACFPRAKKLDRAIQLALAAASSAWEQAGLQESVIPSERIGLVVGSSRGPRGKWMEESKSVLPSDAASSTIASLSGALSQIFSLRGPCFTVSATCASGAAAIALGAQQILLDAADVMLVGGTDAPLHGMAVAQLEAAGVLGHHEDPDKTCRPFDESRNGICLGEGAGFLVLESSRIKKSRSPKPLARLTGWATQMENAGRAGVGEQGETLARTMISALQMAELPPEGIHYINAHGTATVMNDQAEANAIKKVFGINAPPCSSTKPVTGHCLGATPALEAVLCIEALRHQMIPPTANCFAPGCGIDVVPLQARSATLQNVLSNSLGFWGHHAALVFSSCR